MIEDHIVLSDDLFSTSLWYLGLISFSIMFIFRYLEGYSLILVPDEAHALRGKQEEASAQQQHHQLGMEQISPANILEILG